MTVIGAVLGRAHVIGATYPRLLGRDRVSQVPWQPSGAPPPTPGARPGPPSR